MKILRVLVFAFLTGFLACSPDIDKDITTDVQVEGREMFRVSQALEEIYYTAFQSFDNFRTADTLSLPGCPDILINEAERKVTLSFLEERECPSKGSLTRKGKIHISFMQVNILETQTLISYEDYQIQNFKVEGVRTFRRLSSLTNPNRRTEQFSDLFIIDEFGSSTRINGSFEYTLTFANGEVSEIQSSGQLEGRNITGRPLRMSPIQARRYRSNCILTGHYLPVQGEELWQIFRTATLSTSHNLTYEAEGTCNARAKISLSDGRQVLLP